MPSTKPPPETASRGEAARTKLLAAAHRRFLQQGFHGTSMREIAQDAGVAVGGIYNHFSDKEDLFAAVLDAYHPYHSILPALEAVQGDTVEALIQNSAEQVRVSLRDAEKRLLPLIFMEIVEFQGKHLRQLVARILPAALGFGKRLTQAKGHLRALPLPVLLRVFMSMMIGYIITEAMLKGQALFKDEKIDWFGGMVNIYLHGILEPTDQ